jgi:exosortase/archaeosortase family protein
MHKMSKKLPPGLSWESLRAEWRGWFASKAPILLFGAKFGGFMIILYGLLTLPVADKILYSYLEANAWVSHLILNSFGQGTIVSDVTIRSSSSGFAIAIRRGCDAVEPTGLLCGAILAFPGLFVRKLAGMIVGMIILQALNLIRIVSLFWIGSHFTKGPFFDSMHLEIWPALFIIVAIVCFVGWKDWAIEE